MALVTAHLLITFWQKHTHMLAKGRTDANVVGAPFYPYFMAKTGAFFLFTFAAVALAGTLAQINPIWLYGPYTPTAVSAGSQPDFYMGFLEGLLRISPNWTWDAAGHTTAWNVFIPALVVPGLFFGAAAAWPFLEGWITGDRAEHHLNDRPRNAATRTGIAVAAIAFWGILWAEGANDVIADHLEISLYVTTEITRYAIFIGRAVAYLVTKRICLGLQRKDLLLLGHGVATGVVRQLSSGAYVEETRPLTEEERAVIQSRTPPSTLPPGKPAGQQVPEGAVRDSLGRVRLRLNQALTEGIPIAANGHNGYSESNGHQLEGPGQASSSGGGSGEPHSA